MALVRMSEALKQTIRWKMKQIYDPKITAATQAYGRDWGSRLYTEIMAPYAAALAAVDPKFITMTSEIVIKGIRSSRTVALRYKFGKNMPWLAQTHNARNGEELFPGVLSDYGGLVLDPVANPQLAPLCSEIQLYADNIAKVEREAAVATASLNSVLDANTTLAGALKDWRGLWELLPDDYKKRHEAKSEREVSEKPVVDTAGLENLTAEFARKRIIGSGQ